MGGACQLVVSQHECQVQLFQDDNAVSRYQPEGDFVPPITTLVRNMFVLLRQYRICFFMICAAFFSPGNFALQAFEPFERLLEVLRTVDDRAVAERQCVMNAHVDANGRSFATP